MFNNFFLRCAKPRRISFCMARGAKFRFWF